MAINLRSVSQQGVPSQSTCNPNLPVTQAIQIVPKSTQCQNLQPIQPAREALNVTPRNLITDSCGQIVIQVDNAGEGQGDSEIIMGGPWKMPSQADWADIAEYNTDINGYTNDDFLATFQGFNHAAIAGIVFNVGKRGEAFAMVTAFAGNGNAIMLERILGRRFDTSVAANLNFVNGTMRTVLIDNSTNYQVEFGADVYSDITSTGTGTVSDYEWCFGPAGVPITGYTGVKITFPAGFDNDIILCIGAVEGAAFSEGC